MDPLTSFGLACNVLTVLDAAVGVGKELKELYDSSNGYTKATQPLLDATRHLTDTVRILDDAEQQLTSAGSGDQLRRVANECSTVAGTLNAILERCKVNKRRSILSAAMALARSVKNKSEIERLQQEFEAAVDRLRLSMEAATRVDIGRIIRQLDQMSNQQADIAKRLDQIDVDLASGIGVELPKTLESLVALFEEALSAVLNQAILNALRPAAVDLRFNEIKDPEPSTFTWMLGEGAAAGGPANFYSWLKSDSPVFHIIGRPGSGKSTLLKYLVNHNTTRTALEDWAVSDGKDLLVAKFFFWKLGVKDQKTYNGLIRGLLYDIASQNADATRLLFPRYWKGKDRLAGPQPDRPLQLSESDITTAFQRLITEPSVCQRFRICFFIDGLDEFDEADKSHWFLATCLKAWAGHATQAGGTDGLVGSGNIKLCVSSREYDSLVTAFRGYDRLVLHELTTGDISRLIANKLSGNEHFLALSQTHPKECEELVKSMTVDAKGVFLWVVLLIKLLEEELASGIASVDGLFHIVQTAPTELDEFIRQILETIPKHRQQGTYLLFAMALRLMGWSIDRSADVDVEDIIGAMNLKPKYLTAYTAWSLCLTSLPMAVLPHLFDVFEKGHAHRFGNDYVFPAEYFDDDASRRDRKMAKAQSQLVSWSRSLLEPTSNIVVHEYIDKRLGRSRIFKATALNIAVFTHRSIPEVLIEVLRGRASELRFNDVRIAKTLLVTCLAESMPGSGLRAELVTAKLLFICSMLRSQGSDDMVDLFAVMDDLDRVRARRLLNQQSQVATAEPDSEFCLRGELHQLHHGFREIGRTLSEKMALSDIHYVQPSLDLSSSVPTLAADAGYTAFLRWKLKMDPAFAKDKAGLYAALWGVVSAMCDGRFTDSHAACLTLLLRTGVAFDAEMSWGQNDYDEICRSHPTPRLEDEKRPSFADELDSYLIKRSKFQPKMSPWLQTVMFFLQAFLRKGMFSSSHRLQLWQAMELWLQFGARLADNIQLNVLTTGEDYSDFDYMGHEELNFKWSVSFTVDECRHGKTGRYELKDWADIDSSFFGRYADEGLIFSKLFIPLVRAHHKPISFADIIRYWRPPNLERLLGYLEPSSKDGNDHGFLQ